jgi:hypothetical protein
LAAGLAFAIGLELRAVVRLVVFVAPRADFAGALAVVFAVALAAGLRAATFFGAALIAFFGAALRAAGFAVAFIAGLRAAGFLATGAAFFGAALRAVAAFAGAFFAAGALRAAAARGLVAAPPRALVGRAAPRRVEARIAIGCARVGVVSSSFTK